MTSTTGRRRRVPIGCAVAVAVGLAATLLVSRIVWPADEVSITLGGIPSDTEFLCLVAEAAPHATVMNWYVHKVDAAPLHPDDCTISGAFPLSGPALHQGDKRGVGAERPVAHDGLDRRR